MLYLAQVQKKDSEGSATLVLLAGQKSEHMWVVFPEPEMLDAPEASEFNSGMLVLVELSGSNRTLTEIQDAKDWFLSVIDQFLASGVSPAMLQEEAQRAEQWRQSLTLKSQELGRSALEIEARRDQIQELEENLKREKKQLELWATELQAASENLEVNINRPAS